MPRSKYQVISALFDIKPVNENGEIDVVKVSSIEPLLNLGRKLRIGKSGQPALKGKSVARKEKPVREIVQEPVVEREPPPVFYELDPAEDLERYLNEDIDSAVELTAIGAEVTENINAKPRYMPIPAPMPVEDELEPEPKVQEEEPVQEAAPQQEEDYEKILKEIKKPIGPSAENFVGEPKRTDVVDWWLDKKTQVEPAVFVQKETKKPGIRLVLKIKKPNLSLPKISLPKFSLPRINMPRVPSVRLSTKKLIIGGLAIMMLGLLTEYGFSIKNEIVHNGYSAVFNLESAGENIKKLDFTSASTNFAQAYADFAQAGDSLNFMGATMSSLIADLPGGSKLKSAKNLVEAGKLMADAGGAMSQAIEELARTGAIFNPAGSSASIGNISKDLRQALVLSQKNIKEAKELLKKVDSDSLPEDKKASFEEFRSELPEFEKLITDAVDYSKFLEDLIGTAGTKKYLLLFQNPAELRPTGGFPGSYGILVFKDGKLQDFRVDDVYNLDGQLKELYVPPVQLQHIVPNWAMRDVNWFVDFPASARKITEFYKKESGEDVDGIITFSPKIVSRILEITGPIRMDKYNVTLDADNFSQAIQDEVEYKADRNQPKKILVDLAPLMLEEIYSADSDRWMEIFNILVSSVDGKDIFMYFRDLKLQDFSVTKGFSGQVSQTQDDYLMVTLSNIKGSKTDSVVDSQLKVDTIFEGDDVRHRLVLTRTHNGGGTKYGFWNKQAPSYVRILVPDNAQFLGISGNSRPNFKPLLDYPNTDFKRDEDLVRFEEKSYYDGESGITTYEESGKKEYGFWMIINPGETKSVELEYRVSGKSAGKEYEFYLQKQSGLEFNKFELNLVSGMSEISQSSVELKKGDGKYTFSGKLDRDLPVKVIFK